MFQQELQAEEGEIQGKGQPGAGV